jgi:hypothetical protein
MTDTVKGFGLELARKYHLQNVLALCEQILVSEQVQPYTASDLAIGFGLLAEAQAEQLKEVDEAPEIQKKVK